MEYNFPLGIHLQFTSDNIAILSMRNGENGIDMRFIDAFNKALDTVEKNERCRALITTGDGKFYSNGLNLDFLLKKDGENLKNRPMFGMLLSRILTFPMITIAAINGHAFAGGGLIALYHDFRVMRSKRGWISLNEIFLKPELVRLGNNISLIKAKYSGRASFDLMLGKRFTAEEAKEAGIVDVVSSPEVLLSSARELANKKTLKQTYERDRVKVFKEDLYREIVEMNDKIFKSLL